MVRYSSGSSTAPEFVVPFAVAEHELERILREWLATHSLAPGDLASAARLESSSARFLPFWLFDGSALAVYAGRRGEQIAQMAPYLPDASGRRTDGRGNLVDAWGRPTNQFGQQIDNFGRPVVNPDFGPPVNWQPVAGEVRHFFKNFPVRALAQLPNRHVEKLSWHFDASLPYRAEQAADNRAEPVHLDRREAQLQAQNAMDQHLRGLCHQKIGGARQELSSFHSTYSELIGRLTLVPVWLGHYSYRDKQYDLAINGDTGEVVGDRPYSKSKIGLLIGGIVLGVLLLFLGIFAFAFLFF